MTSPIQALTTHTVKLYRYLEGSWIEGKYEKGPVEEITIQGSLQPMRPNELQLLPEGRRTNQAMKFYTVEELRTGNQETGEASDLIEVDDLFFEVHAVEKWTLPGSENAHYKAILLKLNDEAGTA